MLDKLPKRRHEQARLMLRNIPYAETRSEAERLRRVFTRWCGDHSYDAAREAIERDWERMVTFYDYPSDSLQVTHSFRPLGTRASRHRFDILTSSVTSRVMVTSPSLFGS